METLDLLHTEDTMDNLMDRRGLANTRDTADI